MNGRLIRALGRINPSCRDVMTLFSGSLDRDLTRAERVVLAVHLLHCPACHRSRRQVFLLVAALRSLSDGPSRAVPGLPEAVRSRIKQALLAK